MKQELEILYSHIDDIEIVMMHATCRRASSLTGYGHAEARRRPRRGFVTLEETRKLRDLAADPHVNLSYYKDRTREWISVSGIATMTRDRDKIDELYASDWAAWFPKEGDPRHGAKDDPRMVLIGVDVDAAVFLEVNSPQLVVLFEVVKGWLTGSTPEIGEMHHVNKWRATGRAPVTLARRPNFAAGHRVGRIDHGNAMRTEQGCVATGPLSARRRQLQQLASSGGAERLLYRVDRVNRLSPNEASRNAHHTMQTRPQPD